MNPLGLARTLYDRIHPLAVGIRCARKPGNWPAMLHDIKGYLLEQTSLNDLSTTSQELRLAALREAVDWLLRAQAKTADGGVACYSLATGWSTSYPEVTGYVIPTLFRYYDKFRDEKCLAAATRMAEWELSIQNGNGSFCGGYVGKGRPAVVFNTGQVVRGLVSAFVNTGQEKYLDGAVRAGDWLVSIQDVDGAWRKHVYRGLVRCYDSFVAFPLICLWQTTGKSKYCESAIRNLDWDISNQQENGWFANCDNSAHLNDCPLTHTIGYTIDGLLDSGSALGEHRYVVAAAKVADVLLKRFEIDRFLFGRYDKDWKPTVTYSCLTGCAQLSLIFSKLFHHCGDARYYNAALKLNDFLMAMQNRTTANHNLRGAIPGSYPIWGAYQRYTYPSWATKFFADALLLELYLWETCYPFAHRRSMDSLTGCAVQWV